MNILLDAIQEGRLIELPDNDKLHALQILASLIEAIPSLSRDTDVTGVVLARERISSTALGEGWACPHGRLPSDGEMLCAVGWSPTGIDYGAPDGKLVRIVVMYLVPMNQKNIYLKEVSLIAKALQAEDKVKAMETASNLNDVRNQLLDLISSTVGKEGSEVRARMIRLETKLASPTAPSVTLAGYMIEPVTVIVIPGLKPVALCQHRELIELIEGTAGLAETLTRQGSVESGIWRILNRATTNYQGDRLVCDCLAIKATLPGGSANSASTPRA